MQAILVSLLLASVHGGLPGAVSAIEALSGSQILTLVEGGAEAVAPELAKLIGLKPSGNSIGNIIDGVVKAATDDLIKQALKDWLAANGDEAIKRQPGMGSDY